jgi:hypothetical protein
MMVRMCEKSGEDLSGVEMSFGSRSSTQAEFTKIEPVRQLRQFRKRVPEQVRQEGSQGTQS